MEDFLQKMQIQFSKAFYVKPGMLDYELYQQIKNAPVNSYTSFVDKPNVVALQKWLVPGRVLVTWFLVFYLCQKMPIMKQQNLKFTKS
jgi:peptidyl-prolyl cis-trans isomerase SurA